MTAILQSHAQTSPPSAPGQLVEVEGIRLHINCTGPHSGPSVILIAGIGDFSFDWALVQARAEKSNHVCSYDRAGMAWSDRDTAAQNLGYVTRQLTGLLQSAKVPPPYIFVGHSWGGAIARVAAGLVLRKVAGVVLIDGTHEDEILWINGTTLRPRKASQAEWDKVWNPPTPAPGAPGGPPSGTVTMKANAPSIDPPYTHLPRQAQLYRLWALDRPLSMGGGDLRSDLMTLFASRGEKTHPLGDLPLIVITPMAVEYDPEPGFTADELRSDHLRLQADLATLSARGRQIFANNSGHHVQLDDPEIVVSAIRDLVRQTEVPSRSKP